MTLELPLAQEAFKDCKQHVYRLSEFGSLPAYVLPSSPTEFLKEKSGLSGVVDGAPPDQRVVAWTRCQLRKV